MVPGYPVCTFGSCFVTYPDSQLVVLNYETHGKHRPTHPVSESWGTSTVIPDILIHFRRLNQGQSPGSRGGHQRTGRRPSRNSHHLSFSLFIFLYPLNRWRIDSSSKSGMIHEIIPCVYDYTTVRWPYGFGDHLPLIAKAGFSSPLFHRSNLSWLVLPLPHRPPWRNIKY